MHAVLRKHPVRLLPDCVRTQAQPRAANQQLGPDRVECRHTIGATRRLQRLVGRLRERAIAEPDAREYTGVSIHPQNGASQPSGEIP